MTRTKAVKLIYQILTTEFYYGGLPRAIDIYNYISCYGNLEVTPDMINRYFNR